MKTRSILKVWILGCFACLLASCNDYLSSDPSKGTNEPLKSVEQLEGLLANAETFMYETSPTLNFSTDDFGATMDVVANNPSGFSYSPVLIYFTWGVENLANYDSYSNQCWSDQYSKIFVANLIIDQIDNVAGLTKTTRQNYLSEAYFIRALSYWWLVNHYSLPYAEENLEEPGVPLKQTNSYEESLDRRTIADVYALIESDLEKAMKTEVKTVNERWRVSLPAVEAFLSRYYLFTGDYAKVIEHADNALKEKGVTLHDYNTMSTVTDNVWGNDGQVEVNYPDIYFYAPSEYAKYEEFYYTRFLQTWNNPKFFPSEELLGLYDQENDLRFVYLMVKNGAVANQITTTDGNYQYLMFKTSTRYNLLPIGPSIAEVVLNKAEAQARQGDHMGAMTTLDLLREKRIRAGEDYHLTASNKDEAILKVLEERRRELPFVMRWFDIRRFAYNETTIDDVALEMDFFTVENQQANVNEMKHYSLPVKSRRYAVPINQDEINNSRGQIVQNQYE